MVCATLGDEANDVLFCDCCNKPYCMGCAGLAEVPRGDWHCEKCAASLAGEQARHGKGSGIWKVQSFV